MRCPVCCELMIPPESANRHAHDDRSVDHGELKSKGNGSKWLCAVQAVLLEKDATKARTVARQYVSMYLGIPAYQKSLRPFGFTDNDSAEGGSDRVIDSLVLWGGETELRARIDAHYKAGATHVSVLALDSAGGLLPHERALDALALAA